VLPVDVVYGLLLAIVGAGVNRDQHVDGDPTFSFGGGNVAINTLWGQRRKILEFIGAAAQPGAAAAERRGECWPIRCNYERRSRLSGITLCRLI
jgi:hypothetical protein